MANYKEIVTKAVVGKGKKKFLTSHEVVPNCDASTILGCWVINHTFNGTKKGEAISVSGSYDVNIWYSCLNDTKTEVATQHNTYSETVNIKRKSDDVNVSSPEEIIVRSLMQPNCIKAEILDGKIHYTIEKELGIEIVGDTKVKIMVDPTEDSWDDVDVVDDSVEDVIDREVVEDDVIVD